MTRFHRVSALSLVLVTLTSVRSADACSLAAPDTLAGSLPADGAVDVPLDVRPLLIGDIATVEVRDATGELVQFALHEHSQAIELQFEAQLLPDTAYSIQVNGQFGDAPVVGFSTASGNLEQDVPGVEDVVISGLVAKEAAYWVFACSSPTEYLCASSAIPEGHALVIETQLDGGELETAILGRGMDGAFTGGFTFYGQTDAPSARGGMVATGWDPTSCVTLSLQNLAGTRGPSQELCPEDFAVHRLDTLTQVSCEDGALSFEGQLAAGEPGTPSGPDAPTQPNGMGDEPSGEEPSKDEPRDSLNPVTEGASEGCAVGRSSSGGFAVWVFVAFGLFRRVRRAGLDGQRF